MITLLRTDASDPGFTALVALLDAELAVRDGDDHLFYAQLNKTHTIRQVIVAMLNGQAVGCGALRPFAEDDACAEVKRMFVQPEQRGRGIASRVLQELEKWAAEMGYRYCILETGKNQPEAIALYKKSGYTIIPNYGKYAGVYNSVCMKKEIG
jgi:GNAT superfamily N-acetyltransferase